MIVLIYRSEWAKAYKELSNPSRCHLLDIIMGAWNPYVEIAILRFLADVLFLNPHGNFQCKFSLAKVYHRENQAWRTGQDPTTWAPILGQALHWWYVCSTWHHHSVLRCGYHCDMNWGTQWTPTPSFYPWAWQTCNIGLLTMWRCTVLLSWMLHSPTPATGKASLFISLVKVWIFFFFCQLKEILQKGKALSGQEWQI